MAGCNSAKARRRRVVGTGAAVGAFAAAAAMATGSAPSARADILDNILDPIIQPLVTSLTDAVGAIDPAAATDLTSLFDMSALSLSSVDPAAAVSQATQFDNALNALFGADLFGASATQPAAAAASAAAATPTNVDVPMGVAVGTEPYVDVSVNGGPAEPVLVDTGSSGLVIPIQDIGWWNLATLGFPTGGGISGYSGGVDYFYLTFNTPVSFDNLSGSVLDTTTGSTSVEVPIFSWPTSLGGPLSIQQFFQDDGVQGILGIGENAAGPSVSPITALPGDLSQGVTVNVPGQDLILGPNPFTTGYNDVSTSGAPISNLLVSIDGGAAQPVSQANIDSGGVYGAIPSSLLTSSEWNSSTDTVDPGTVISVYNSSHQLLYSYTVTATNSPTVVSGGTMDTGYVPFSQAPIFTSYSPSPNGTTTFDLPAT
ncbi:MAG: PecA family PE domain-processing aspartic protease [Mycobacterium sp.]|nr:PecA family PE domain-processing aspartic protease [Mycobacterium sp.]